MGQDKPSQEQLKQLFDKYQLEAEQSIQNAFRRANFVKLQQVYNAGYEQAMKDFGIQK
jgi:hypothetical protein